MNGKAIWLSKTLWVNLLAVIGLIVQSYFGFVISPESQVMILAGINAVLRLVTKQPITWSPGAGADNSGFIRPGLLLLLAFMIAFIFTLALLAGCATNGVNPLAGSSPSAGEGPPTDTLQKSITIAQTGLTVLKGGCDMAPLGFAVALQTGAIAWADYDNDLAITGRICAGVSAAQAALNDCQAAGVDPNGDPNYLAAIGKILADKDALNGALKAAGVNTVTFPAPPSAVVIVPVVPATGLRPPEGSGPQAGTAQ